MTGSNPRPGWHHSTCKNHESSYWCKAARTARRIVKEMQLAGDEAAIVLKFASKCSTLAAYARQGYEPRTTTSWDGGL